MVHDSYYVYQHGLRSTPNDWVDVTKVIIFYGVSSPTWVHRQHRVPVDARRLTRTSSGQQGRRFESFFDAVTVQHIKKEILALEACLCAFRSFRTESPLKDSHLPFETLSRWIAKAR